MKGSVVCKGAVNVSMRMMCMQLTIFGTWERGTIYDQKHVSGLWLEVLLIEVYK